MRAALCRPGRVYALRRAGPCANVVTFLDVIAAAGRRVYTSIAVGARDGATLGDVVRVPRLLFFGGDVVSVVALEALHTRLSCIVRHALSLQNSPTSCTAAGLDAALEQRVGHLVRDHLTVVCPSLPPHLAPHEVGERYTRQYPVARFCAERQVPVIAVDHPRSFAKSRLLQEMLQRGVATHDAEAHPTWAAQGKPLTSFDLAIVVSFRYFLPKRLLQAMPPTINMHPSLLPRYRGASPIFSTLLRNETRGGVSIIQMTPEQTLMDSGNVLWQCEVPIAPDMDIRLYFPLVTQIGAAGLCDLVFGEADDDDGHGGTHSDVDGCDTATKDTEWRTLFRRPPRLTSAAVAHAARVHRGHLTLQQSIAAPTTPPRRWSTLAPAAVAVSRQCAGVFPRSVLNPHCDWPDSFTYSWRFAPAQQCEAFAHFSADPHHAPLLPRDAAVLYFDRYTDLQAFGVWRAFVGGQYFHPATQCVLDRTRTPVHAQLRHRVVRRLARAHGRTDADVLDPSSAAYAALARQADAELRVGCSFTQSVHPHHVAPAVVHELRAMEAHDAAPQCGSHADRNGAECEQAVIAPGTGYFPRADEELGAVRCREGWFFWKATHLQSAARAQPASLLRKGLAMKLGVLYPHLFTGCAPATRDAP